MRYEVSASVPPDRMEWDILEDGEPPQVVDFPPSPGTDSRFFRAFAFKPTREVSNATLAVRAYRGGRLVATTTCGGVNVTR